MRRLFNYYIGLLLFTWLLLWITHFAVEPVINIHNIYTQRAIIETIILVINTVLLFLNKFYTNKIVAVLSLVFLVTTMFLYGYLLVELIEAKSYLFNLPFYIAYGYCFIFSGILLWHRYKLG